MAPAPAFPKLAFPAKSLDAENAFSPANTAMPPLPGSVRVLVDDVAAEHAFFPANTATSPLPGGVRVLVDDVAAEQPSLPKVSGQEHVTRMHKRATACSHLDQEFLNVTCDTSNALLTAAVTAFQRHLPLELTPDVIFSTIMAGVSAHVNANPEQFRSSFVAHKGKKTLSVRDDSLRLGSWENRWDRPVAQLGELVMANLSNPSARRILCMRFSTTGLAQAAAHTMTFMDVVKAYFEYRLTTACGIPHIDIAGSREDWQQLAAAISPLLSELSLGGWNQQLQGILSHFVAAYDGQAAVDRRFWQGILKYNGPRGSGGEATVTGWLAELFPYLDGNPSPAVDLPGGRSNADGAANPHKVACFTHDVSSPASHAQRPRIALSRFPGSTTSTPFVWDYHGVEYKMKLVAGSIGVVTSQQGALKPEVGWLVAHESD